MRSNQVADLFRYADEYELRLCQRTISWAQDHELRAFFKTVSRLGDGLFWYAVILFVIVFIDATAGSWMALTGLVATLFYKILKAMLVRERPYITHRSVSCAAAPLDRYSFPSGHTLHGTCFFIVLTYINPLLGFCVLPFTLSVALSRVVLGLHYPSDVVAGIVVGISIASTSIALYPF